LGESSSVAAAGSTNFMREVSSSWHPLDFLSMRDVAAVSMVRRHDIAIDTLFADFYDREVERELADDDLQMPWPECA